MQTTYNFTITLRPYGDDPNVGIVQIDPAARYGYWEHRDGTEGGGLWFEPQCAQPTPGGTLELADYDGAFALPRKVIAALRAAGFTVTEDFE